MVNTIMTTEQADRIAKLMLDGCVGFEDVFCPRVDCLDCRPNRHMVLRAIDRAERDDGNEPAQVTNMENTIHNRMIGGHIVNGEYPGAVLVVYEHADLFPNINDMYMRSIDSAER